MKKNIMIAGIVAITATSAIGYALYKHPPRLAAKLKKMPTQADAIGAQSTCTAIGKDWELANSATLINYSKSNPSADLAITGDLMPGGLFNSVDLATGKAEPVPNWKELSVYCVQSKEQLTVTNSTAPLSGCDDGDDCLSESEKKQIRTENEKAVDDISKQDSSIESARSFLSKVFRNKSTLTRTIGASGDQFANEHLMVPFDIQMCKGWSGCKGYQFSQPVEFKSGWENLSVAVVAGKVVGFIHSIQAKDIGKVPVVSKRIREILNENAPEPKKYLQFQSYDRSQIAQWNFDGGRILLRGIPYVRDPQASIPVFSDLYFGAVFVCLDEPRHQKSCDINASDMTKISNSLF